MRSWFAFLVVLAATAIAPRLQAFEPTADIETDHIDAAVEGQPRSVALLLDPLGNAWGVSTELDVMLSESVGLSVEGDWPSPFAWGYGASIGAPLFPLRSAFRALYVHPRIAWARVDSSGEGLNLIGTGATAGYEWTWPVGATLRLGGGGVYEMSLVTPAGTVRGLMGLRALVDASVGWVF